MQAHSVTFIDRDISIVKSESKERLSLRGKGDNQKRVINSTS